MSDTSIGNVAVVGGGFRVGRVLSKSLAILAGNFPRYLVFGAVLALPSLISAFYVNEQRRLVEMLPRSSLLALEAGLLLLWVILFALCQSAMIYGAFQDIRGRPFDIGASVGRGFHQFLPVVGTAICAFIMTLIGFILLVVPSLIFLTMFFVVIPVCVLEGLGPIQSLRRSRELTKGHRWRILAIYLVPTLVITACNLLLQRYAIAVLGVAGYAAMTYLVTAVGSSYQLITNLATYYELRSVKEGLDIEKLAAVFD